MKLLTLVFTLIFSGQTFACEKNVQYTLAGTVTKCDAWLVKDSQMQEFAKQTDLLKLSEQSGKLSLREIEYYKKRAEQREEQLNRAENKKFFYITGAFILGVVVTGLAAKAAIEATK